MTDNKHPITPPPELIAKWASSMCGYYEAARWGADQELLACGKYLERCAAWEEEDVTEMYNSRRPKPLSPKEEALQVLEALIESRRIVDPEYQALRHALEQLDD